MKRINSYLTEKLKINKDTVKIANRQYRQNFERGEYIGIFTFNPYHDTIQLRDPMKFKSYDEYKKELIFHTDNINGYITYTYDNVKINDFGYLIQENDIYKLILNVDDTLELAAELLKDNKKILEKYLSENKNLSLSKIEEYEPRISETMIQMYEAVKKH